MTAEVIVDIAHVRAGCRVRVPFGGRTVEGYVMRLKEGSDFDPAKLKSVLSVVDEPLTAECLSLVESISARYHCPKALVLRLFLPSEMRKGAVRELFKTVALLQDKDAEIPARAKAQAAAFAFLQENPRFGYTELCDKFGRGAVKYRVRRRRGRSRPPRARRWRASANRKRRCSSCTALRAAERRKST